MKHKQQGGGGGGGDGGTGGGLGQPHPPASYVGRGSGSHTAAGRMHAVFSGTQPSEHLPRDARTTDYCHPDYTRIWL